MSERLRRGVLGVVTVALAATLACGGAPSVSVPGGGASERRHLLLVLDGLRPDYITPELMPRLHDLGAEGVVFADHHAVFPTVTRVNAASIATGAYPETHGLLGNSVFVPAVDPQAFLGTADRANLVRIEGVEPRLLTAPTIGEELERVGRRMLVVSSGSSGSAYLLNHTVAGGGIIHYDFALPVALGQAVRRRLGAPPPRDMPNAARNRYAVDAFLEVGLDRVDPAVTVLWLSDPDTTAHTHGIGHPRSVAALRAVDREVGRIVDGLADGDRLDEFNIWVTSDHGFATHTGAVDLDAVIARHAVVDTDGVPSIVGQAGAVYVRDGDRATVTSVVEALQRDPRVGAVFTPDGHVPGTLPFALIRWSHPRSADVLFAPSWTDDTNRYGYRGTSASGGTAGHGGASPWEVRNVLVARGPDLGLGIEVSAPSSNVDLAPTFLTLLGLSPPTTMQGRVLTDALRGAASSAVGPVVHDEHEAAAADGRYRALARTSSVDDHRYVEWATATRP